MGVKAYFVNQSKTTTETARVKTNKPMLQQFQSQKIFTFTFSPANTDACRNFFDSFTSQGMKFHKHALTF